MKKLTREEFHDRLQAINRARKIFIESGLTNNISVAFEIYQEMIAEVDRQLKLTKELSDGRIGNMFDEYDRPECPDCGADMYIRPVFGEKLIFSQLVCSNQKCDTAFNSIKTIMEWQRELKKRET